MGLVTTRRDSTKLILKDAGFTDSDAGAIVALVGGLITDAGIATAEKLGVLASSTTADDTKVGVYVSGREEFEAETSRPIIATDRGAVVDVTSAGVLNLDASAVGSVKISPTATVGDTRAKFKIVKPIY